jgi:hypothetical protein
VRRAPLAGFALALTVLAASLAPGASGAPSPPASASADCVPVQHSKRVTKRVKVRRKGRVVKVKRKKTVRWETCEQVPSAPASPATLAPCPEPSANLLVTARDNDEMPRYTLSRPCVTAGTVRVQLENQGEDPHHVFVRAAGSGSTAPAYRIPDDPPLYELDAWDGMGAPPTAEADIALTPGDWYLWCDLLLHEEQGMSATLQVR